MAPGLPSFKSQELLQKALTHPSFRRRRVNDFERLEFLGDRVLGFVIAQLLYKKFPHEKEGDLAKRSAALVNRDICCEIAQEIGLDNHVKAVGTQLNEKTSVLGDAMEALIGAFYLDSGLEATQDYIESVWLGRLNRTKKPLKDFKSQLQEWSQSKGLGIPTYHLKETSGPSHAPQFVLEVTIGTYTAQALGATRKQAEQEAAKTLLESLQSNASSSTLRNKK